MRDEEGPGDARLGQALGNLIGLASWRTAEAGAPAQSMAGSVDYRHSVGSCQSSVDRAVQPVVRRRHSAMDHHQIGSSALLVDKEAPLVAELDWLFLSHRTETAHKAQGSAPRSESLDFPRLLGLLRVNFMSDMLCLRPIVPGDIAGLHRIRRLAFAPIFESFRELVGPDIAPIAFATAEDEQARHLDEICAPASGHHVFAVFDGAEMVGFVSFTVDPRKRSGEIGLNAVAPDRSGRGIGAWMYEQALARMKTLGAEVVEVGTGGDAAHAPARRAYEKAGFTHSIPGAHFYRKI